MNKVSARRIRAEGAQRFGALYIIEQGRVVTDQGEGGGREPYVVMGQPRLGPVQAVRRRGFVLGEWALPRRVHTETRCCVVERLAACHSSGQAARSRSSVL